MLIGVGVWAGPERQAGAMNVVVDVEGGDFSKWGHMEYACYVRWYVTDARIGIWLERRGILLGWLRRWMCRGGM